MLHSFNHIRGHTIQASDGEIGSLHDLYFDDQSTAIRYLVVDTGSWLPGRRVLLAPAAVGGVGYRAAGVVTGLTRQQVKDGPDVYHGQARSRASRSCSLHTYYGWDPSGRRRRSTGMLTPYWGAAIPSGRAPSERSPRRRDRGARAGRRRTRICAARARSRATTSRPPTARSATSRTS